MIVPLLLLLALPTQGTPIDFTPFEDHVLPLWLSRFSLNYTAGLFSFSVAGSSSLYGSVDVIHTLATVGRLNLPPHQLDAWAEVINGYQTVDGYYMQSSGNSKYHAAGEATASLALLGRFPRYNNTEFEQFASAGSGVWRPFFDSLYFNNATVFPGKIGCGSSIHGCGQVIGSIPSVLAYSTGSKHADFIRWWSSWLAYRTNPTTGTLCPLNATRRDLFDSLGGGMATHGIQLGIGAGEPTEFPFEISAPRTLLDFALSLQSNSTGVWVEPKHDGEVPSRLGSISLDGIFQAVRSSEQLARHGDGSYKPLVNRACDVLLRTSARQLNNATLVLELYGGDSHQLPNVVAAVGECARAFPELVHMRRKWGCCARYV